MAALSYTQNFDSLSNGDLNGQDSWTSSSGSGTTVQTGVVLDGTKSVKQDTPNNGDNDYQRTVSDADSGDFFFAFRVEDASGNKSFQFRDNGGAGTVFFIGIPGSTAVSWSGDKVTLYGTAANTVESTFATATKFYVNVQFDDAAQPDKARARVWRSGTGWGSWTSWVAVTSYTKINQLRIDAGGGDGTGASVSYLDTFQETDPTGGSFSQTCSDALSGATDAIARSVARTIAESTTNTDALTTVKVLTQNVADALSGVTDSVINKAGKVILDTLTMTDSVMRATGKTILDALSMASADAITISKVAVQTILDALSMAASDVVVTASTLARTISDALSGVTDAISIRSLWAPRSKPTSTWTPRSKS